MPYRKLGLRAMYRLFAVTDYILRDADGYPSDYDVTYNDIYVASRRQHNIVPYNTAAPNDASSRFDPQRR